MVTIRTRSFSVQPLGSVAIGVCLLVLVACSREQQDWRSAEAADSIQAYGQFIERHPDSELVKEARGRIVQLGEDQDWARAGSADTVEAYREFVAQHPNGRWAQEARIRVQNFSLTEQAAPSRSAAAAPPRPAATPPPAAASTPGRDEFGIQLGAFGNEAAASTQWQVLTTKFGPELQGLQERIIAADTPSGRVYRLQAQVGAEAQARAICNSLHLHAQACVPVLPH